jgi:Fic family protein
MNIGSKIKKYRELQKMTQKNIAEILGVEPGTISKYESGIIEPNIDSIKKLAETFNITIDELLKDEEKIDISKINVLNALREQKEMKLKGNLYHNTQIIFAYNTNHIEGNKLTENQTRYIFETNSILFEGETVANVDDILETSNHFKMVDYMLDIAGNNLTEDIIKKFHKILKEGTMDSRKEWFMVGDYKKIVNEAGQMQTSSPKQTPKDMAKLIKWYNSLEKVTIKDIIEFHYKFEKIHPFQDGNGRVGRIIMFKECLKNNIIPFIILDTDKLFYYRGLKEYRSEKGYLLDTCLNAQDQYKKMIEYYLK